MLYNTGYMAEVDQAVISDRGGLTVGSCGHFKLLKMPSFKTHRPNGRRDFQLLYVAKGLATFYLNSEIYHLKEGDFFLYFPDIPQSYIYQLVDNPDIYWIHFYETPPYPVLEKLGFNRPGLYTPTPNSEFPLLFDKIIHELQVRRKDFETLCNVYGLAILTLLSRHCLENTPSYDKKDMLLEHLLEEIHASFNMDVPIKTYAQNYHMSCSWLIRSFKRRTGQTPQQYIISIRINQAKELLKTSDFNIGEIAAYVGYPNPLYFSRIFTQSTGVSPSAYRRQ